MKNIQKISTMLLAVMFLFTAIFATPVRAEAATNDPYVYVWDDASGVTHYQLYVYDAKEGAYIISNRVTSIGTTVFNVDGTTVMSDIITGKYGVNYAQDSRLFGISKDGKLFCISNGVKTTYTNYTYKKLILNDDDIVTAFETSTGKVELKNLGNGTENPSNNVPSTEEQPTNTPTNNDTNKSKDRIDRIGDVEITVEAISNNQLKFQLLVKGSKVLNKTAGVRLSDTVKGAKFLGIDRNYSVYLYETNGALYRFKCDNWYSADKMYLEGTFKSFTEDSDGFLSTVKTSKKTYNVKDLNKTSAWKAKKTYAVNKDTYATIYVKNKEVSHTLSLNKGVLSYDGNVILKDVKKFGFASASQIVVITKDGAKKGTLKNGKFTFANIAIKSPKSLTISKSNGLVTAVKGKKTVKI